MSRTRRNFSAKFRSQCANAVPLLENGQLYPVSSEREDNLKEKLALERKEKAEYAKKVGQLTMQVDWLKKKSEETLGPDYESKFSPKPFED